MGLGWGRWGLREVKRGLGCVEGKGFVRSNISTHFSHRRTYTTEFMDE